MDSKPFPYPLSRDKRLSIGAFSNASRLSQKALRLYDRHGLLKPVYIDPENGYRYYCIEQLHTARLIQLMRQMDMPLAKIRRMLAASSAEAGNMAMTYTEQAEERAKRTRNTLGELMRCLQSETSGEAMMSESGVKIEAREMAPQLVLSVSKRVKIDALEEHVQNTPKRLRAFAESAGGTVTAAGFGIFHGPVNKDDDGPMEVCLPVQGAFSPSGDIVVRELSGGPMILVSGTGEYRDFPKVLELYDKAVEWMCQNGFEKNGPPREWWQGMNGEADALTVVWPYRPKSE